MRSRARFLAPLTFLLAIPAVAAGPADPLAWEDCSAGMGFGPLERLVVTGGDEPRVVATFAGAPAMVGPLRGPWQRLRVGYDLPVLTRVASSLAAPESVWAVDAAGTVLRSLDAASTWERLPLPEGVTEVTEVVLHQADAGGVILRLPGTDFLLSKDAGKTFERRTMPLERDQVVFSSVVFTPKGVQEVYAAGPSGEISRSTDGGRSWESCPPHGVPGFEAPTRLHPTSGGSLLLVGDAGILRSTDGARTWSRALSGTSISLQTPTEGAKGRLWHCGSDGKLYQSSRDGERWQKSSPFAEFVPDGGLFLAASPVRAGLLMMATRPWGLSLSEHGGLTHRAVAPRFGAPPIESLEPLAGAPDELFAGSPVGHFRTKDGGASWNDTFTVTGGLSLTGLVAIPAQTPTLLAAHGGKLVRSTDRGSTWQACGPGGLADISRMERDREGVIWITSATGTLHRSRDGGATYEEALEGDEGSRLEMTRCGDRLLLCRYGRGSAGISSDMGEAFVTVEAPWLSSGKAFMLGERILHLDPLGLVRVSTDGGATWADHGRIPPREPMDRPGAGDRHAASCLIEDPAFPGTLHAGTRSGPFTSRDGGKTWERQSKGIPPIPVSQLRIVEGPTRVLYAATSSGVFRAPLPPRP